MKHKTSIVTALSVAAAATLGGVAAASSGRPVDVPERIKGAESVVIATAGAITPTWRRNNYGDQLIVSEVLLKVEETLKGTPEASRVLDLEGGTLSGYTLHVSDLPELNVGDRAVFFLDRTNSHASVPHLRGLGILKLDRQNQVTGTSLSLDDIRHMARGQGR
jgi:hypothetical protein